MPKVEMILKHTSMYNDDTHCIVLLADGGVAYGCCLSLALNPSTGKYSPEPKFSGFKVREGILETLE